jgi:hypothetical protein
MDGPTSYPDVNAVLRELLSGVRAILGKHFVGMYLYGSLSGGDFTPDRSDIDFVAVTADDLPDEMISALAAMHARMAGGSPWGRELEGTYIPQRALRRHDPADAVYPHIERGEHLVVEQHDSAGVIQRHILREQGITLAGPPPHTLIDPIQPNDLRRATLAILRGWWAPMLDDPALLYHPGYQAYAVLTMCRALYTLQHGTVVSKPAAARWAHQALGERWAGFIERADAWRNGMPFDHLNEMLDFIRYTLERSGQFEIPEAGQGC